jgi:hypothetical protein
MIMDQVTNGVAVRMAVLYVLVASRKAVSTRKTTARALAPPGIAQRASQETAVSRRESRGAA